MALFVFIGRIRFREACLATVFFVAAMLLVAKDCHLGSRLAGACIVLGALWFGGLTAACAVKLWLYFYCISCLAAYCLLNSW